MVATGLLAIGFVAGLFWKLVKIDRCYDRGGIVVAPLMRDQECFTQETANDTAPSSRP